MLQHLSSLSFFMNGAAMLTRLRADARTKEMPVILMTSLPETIVANEASGYAAYLAKPFLDREMIAVLAKALPQRP